MCNYMIKTSVVKSGRYTAKTREGHTIIGLLVASSEDGSICDVIDILALQKSWPISCMMRIMGKFIFHVLQRLP